MAVRLKVVHGMPQGHSLQLGEGEHLFGRTPECHICPDSDLVSRRHCLLRIHGRHLCIRDLGSANGTFVNGNRLSEERALIDGDILQLGPVVFQVDLSDEGDGPISGRSPVIPAGIKDALARIHAEKSLMTIPNLSGASVSVCEVAAGAVVIFQINFPNGYGLAVTATVLDTESVSDQLMLGHLHTAMGEFYKMFKHRKGQAQWVHDGDVSHLAIDDGTLVRWGG